MQTLLKICEQFGDEFGLTYYPDKCETLVFGDNMNINLTLCNKNIKVVNKAKHLGHFLANTRNIFDLSSMIADIKTKTNVIMSQFNFLSFDSRIRIFNSNCSSYYGYNLTNIASCDIKDLDRAWRVCARRVLKVSTRTHSNMLPHLMSTLPPSLDIITRMHGFFLNGFNHSSNIISFYFRNCLINKEGIMFKNLSYISIILGMNISNFITMQKREVKRKICALSEIEANWKIDFIKDILGCLENSNSNASDKENFSDILDCLCICP